MMQMQRMRARSSSALVANPNAPGGGGGAGAGAGAGGDKPKPKQPAGRALRVPKFLRSLYDILHYEDPSILAWAKDGTYFQILDTARLETQVLPKYFKHGKFASFQRQLNNFGFRKWTKTQSTVCTFSHHDLVRRHPQQLAELIARRPSPSTADTTTATATAAAAPRRKRTFAELVGEATNPSASKPSKRVAVSSFPSARKAAGNAKPLAKKPAPRWVTEPVAFVKAEEGSHSGTPTSSSADQPFHFSPEELHDIILPAVPVERHDARPQEKMFELRMLNECLDLGPAGVGGGYIAAGSNGDFFPTLPYAWDSDAFFAPPSRPHFDAHLQDRGLWRTH